MYKNTRRKTRKLDVFLNGIFKKKLGRSSTCSRKKSLLLSHPNAVHRIDASGEEIPGLLIFWTILKCDKNGVTSFRYYITI